METQLAGLGMAKHIDQSHLRDAIERGVDVFAQAVSFEREHARKIGRDDRLGEHGLPNGRFAPVDKPPQGLMGRPSACPQASPLNSPAPEHSGIIPTQPE